VAWEDCRNNDEDIYGQLVDADGTLLGANLPIEALMAGDQTCPDVATDGEDFLVVWQGDQTGTPVIYGHVVEGNGHVIPVLHTISQGGGVACQEPAIAYNATADEYLVVFQYDEGDPIELHGRRVTPAGALPGSEYTIADQPRVLRLFDALTVADTAGVLAEVRAAAAGTTATDLPESSELSGR